MSISENTHATPHSASPVCSLFIQNEQLVTLDKVLLFANPNIDQLTSLIYNAAHTPNYDKKKLFLFLVHLSKLDPKSFIQINSCYLTTGKEWVTFLDLALCSQSRKYVGRTIKQEIIKFLKNTTPDNLTKSQFTTLTKTAHPTKEDTAHLQCLYL